MTTVEGATNLIDEANRETLECARYGDDEDLRNLFVSYGADANYADNMGNTAMHRAAANGEVRCLEILKEFGAEHKQNNQGNFPIHWAALNGKAEALKYIFDNYEVDVLVQNSFGRSTLSEAFQSQKTEVIELCLSHPSATEEKLIDTTNKSGNATVRLEESVNDDDDGEQHAVVHVMDLTLPECEITRRTLRVRELPITRADNPFGSEAQPENDTTGLGLWPASVLLARWAVQERSLLEGKVVIELGAGCGLPSLAAAIYCSPRLVYITDIHAPTLKNAIFNMRLNATSSLGVAADTAEAVQGEGKYLAEVEISHQPLGTPRDDSDSLSTRVRVAHVNWGDTETFPPEKADVLLGSDLVYDEKILGLFVRAVDGMLKEGGVLLYVAPDGDRDGMDSLIDTLKNAGIHCEHRLSCPDSMFENPLADADIDNSTITSTASAISPANNENQLPAAPNGDMPTTSTTISPPPPPSEESPQQPTSESINTATSTQFVGKKEALTPVVDRGDNFVLHFYDLAARKPHTLYKFVKSVEKGQTYT